MSQTLILNIKPLKQEIHERVYGRTLSFIANHLEGTVQYQFVGHKDFLDFLKKHDISTVITTSALETNLAYLLKGLGVVQIIIGSNPELMAISDITIDPLVRKSNIFPVGTRYLLSEILECESSSQIAELLNMSVEELSEEVSHYNAQEEILEVTRLYQKLDWDSKFFGINIAFISCLRLTPNIEQNVKQFIRREKIDLLEYLCNCHDRQSVLTLERNGYSFVDMRLTFEQFIDKRTETHLRDGFSFRKAIESDIPALRNIANGIYQHSRYYFDDNFDRKKVIEFYLNWVEKGVRGQFDDFAYVLEHQSKAIGFCTIKRTRKNAVSIGLFGLDAAYTGQGLAKYLLNKALDTLKSQEAINYVEVVTQGRNYEAQRLYQRCGFVTKSTELWYHKWFH